MTRQEPGLHRKHSHEPVTGETHLGMSARGRMAPHNSSRATTTWLAMGVIVTKWMPPFRRRSARPLGIEWRYVSTQREYEADPRYIVITSCPDVFVANVRDADPTRLPAEISHVQRRSRAFAHAPVRAMHRATRPR